MAKLIILRTDSGEILGWFRNVKAAKRHAETVKTDKVLVITSESGVVLSRCWPPLSAADIAARQRDYPSPR